MAINGICELRYGVEDLERSTKFFEDFGLSLVERTNSLSRFVLTDGSQVSLQPVEVAKPAASGLIGDGVQETVLGVDTQEEVERFVERLRAHGHTVIVETDGLARFTTRDGLPLALRQFTRKRVVAAPDPLNAPGVVNRLNRPRRWRNRAIPKAIQHVVFGVVDPQATFEFLRDMLDFRITDYQPGLGVYTRCAGANNHHNIFLLNANAHLPGMDGQLRFHHANFGLEDVDEIMVGANRMTRRGWGPSHFGLGRHRIDSALFYYLPCPAGGEAEYGADGDYVDDGWIPRHWTSPMFGFVTFMHQLPDFLAEEPAWEVRYLTEADGFGSLEPTAA